MIVLLLPLWLNLEGGGGPPAPTHHDAPGERYLMCAPDDRAMTVERPDGRVLAVEAVRREFSA